MDSQEHDALVGHLRADLEDRLSKVRLWDAYYEGEQRLQALGLALPPEMHRLQVVINWPRKYVDSLESRLDIEGFRIVGQDDDENDEALMNIWKYNNLDDESSIAHTEALALSHCYVTVGVNEEDPSLPLISVESPYNMIARTNPRTREVESALRFYDHDRNGLAQALTLYLPNETVYARRDGSQWDTVEVDRHNSGEVPVVPVVNRSRVADRHGKTEMADIMGLTDAACRTLTNLQGAQELMAVPQRYILGADSSLFQDADGSPVPTWQAYLANILAIPEEGATVGQFNAAELRNFTETVTAYARHVSAMTGLPPHDLGLAGENPASAEAIKSAENRLVKQVERKQRSFGAAWSRVMDLAARMAGLGERYEPRTIDPVWRDASTPTFAQKTDAVVKLVQQGILDQETALEELGYGPGRIEKIQERKENSGLGRLDRLIAESENDGTGGVREQATPDQQSSSAGGAAAPPPDTDA